MNQDHPYREDGVRVEVGNWASDGTFLGSIIEFYGQEVGNWSVITTSSAYRRDREVVHTLYRVAHPDGGDGYRVYEKTYRFWRGERDSAFLYPVEEKSLSSTFYQIDPMRPRREPYIEDEARARFPQLFSAIGWPKAIRLYDEED